MVQKTALILLAAGASRRMGSVKQLLPLKNEPTIRFCLHRILAAGLGEVVVVLGNHRQRIAPHITDLPVAIAVNTESDSEMADSVGIGRKAVSKNATGIMIHPVDQPIVLTQTYRRVADQHMQNPEQIIVPTFENRGGHPTLFPAWLLHQHDGFQPLNLFMQRHRKRVLRLPLDDSGVVLDMDYHRDYERFTRLV